MMEGSRLAHYLLGRQVGEGGMGAVYQATDERTGQQVAIKVMRQEYTRSREALTRFFNEARAVNLIEHPVLVRIMEHAQLTGGLAYLVMEFLDGETLSARMRRYNGPMPEVEARRIVWLLAGALAAAHKKGIIHRDLKPGNVMLVPDLGGGPDRVKLLDFGIAKLDTQHLNLDDPQTRTGVLMGTPYYMSPEQCRGAASVDDRADVYSLGVILYQLLTGRLPFLGEGDGTVMAMHIYEQAAPPRALVPSITTAMEDVVLQMLRKEREQRPSMHIVARRLEELGAAVGMSSDLSMTFEDSPETGRIPEAATVVNRPAVPLAQGTAANLVHTPGSQPSLPSAQITTPQPATLGPVTGQVAMMTRYKRSLMAGVAGATALLLVVGVSVFVLRDHTPKAKLVETPVVPRENEDSIRSATTQQVQLPAPVVPRKEPPPVVPPTAPEPVTQTPTPEVEQEVPQEKPIPQRKVTSPSKSKAQRRLYLAKLKKKKKQQLLLKKKKKQQQQKANAAPGKKNISIVD